MEFFKVITHDTTFHADDVFAVALLRHAGYIFEFERTRDAENLATAKASSDILVLDVGGEFDPEMLNFDHHQDMALQSAAGLIYQQVKNLIGCSPQALPFFEAFIKAIDAIDTNRDNIYATWNTLPSGFRHASSVIGGFNRDVTNPAEQKVQFRKALEFAEQIIENEVYAANKKADSERLYESRLVLPNNVAVFDEYSTVWKDKREHVFVVLPHSNGWQIQTIDTTIAKVPESVSECSGFVFRHGSGFMAVVKEKEVAVQFAKNLAQLTPSK